MSTDGRLEPNEHSSLPWRIHDIAPDFDLIDAWALPAAGTIHEFADLCEIVITLDPAADPRSTACRTLFAVRARLGYRLGWDKPEVSNTLPIPGCTESSLRDRIPAALADTGGDSSDRSNFRSVFIVADEAAFELSNSLLHAICHLGWVPQPDGTYHGQMGVYVKHRSLTGARYMTLIAPFRHRIVYPALLRRLDAAWRSRTSPPTPTDQERDRRQAFT